MKSTFKTDTKVGIFVILATAVLVIGTTLVGKFRFGRPEGYTVTAVFGSISGLEMKSPVRIAGVRVGEVEDIYLKDGLAYVEMRLSPESVIREDSEVTIASLGLLGEKYVEISSGSLDKPVVKAGSRVQGKDVVSMEKLIDQFTDIATDIKAVTAALRSFLGPEQAESPIRELIRNFDVMVMNINELIGENKEGITQAVSSFNQFASRADTTLAENQEDIRIAIRNFRNLSEKLEGEVSSLGERIDGLTGDIASAVEGARGDFSGGMDEIKKVAARIDETVISLKEIIDRTRRGEGTVGKLLKEETTYDSLNRTLDSISSISEKIERGEGALGKLLTEEEAYTSLTDTLGSINKFITKGEQTKLYVGFRSEYLYDSDDTKSYFSLNISPREDKFYLLEVIDDPRGRRTVTDTSSSTTVDGSVTNVTRHEERTEDELKFSLQFARRFSDLVLRGGLIESTGGLAADYMFGGDKGKVSLEAWDFNRDELDPHVKITAAYNIYKGLFINAGVDDLVEDESRSFFIGAGLSFSDDDLKYILSLTNLRP